MSLQLDTFELGLILLGVLVGIVIISLMYVEYQAWTESQAIKTMNCNELKSKIQKNDFVMRYNLDQATSLYTVNCVATKS